MCESKLVVRIFQVLLLILTFKPVYLHTLPHISLEGEFALTD